MNTKERGVENEMPGIIRQIGWRFTSVSSTEYHLQRRVRRVSTGEYRGRRKIRLKWRGWLPNPPIHQSYAGRQWRYCFKFVAQPLSRGRCGAWCLHPEREREEERERGYEVLSSLSLVSCTTSRGKTSRVASREREIWFNAVGKKFVERIFSAKFFNSSLVFFRVLFRDLVEIRTNDVTMW